MKRLPLAALLAALVLPCASQAGKFSYHGELMDGDAPAEGTYDLRVRSFAQHGDQKALGEPTELPGVALSQGRFSVELDIPEDVDGVTWVEVAVRRAGSGDAYETLGDPQPISKANSTCPGAWALDGNSGMPAGSFLGIAETSATPLVLKANNLNVARFTPYPPAAMGHGDAPSVALGSASNVASGIGATVGGGGATKLADSSGCPECKNTASGEFSTVGGGRKNTASGARSTVTGGGSNTASGSSSTIAGGDVNTTSGVSSTVGGGEFNTANSNFSTISGGNRNTASGSNSTVSGGYDNTASNSYSTVGGGTGNAASGYSSTVSGGMDNCAGGHASWAGGTRSKVRSRSGSTGDAVCGSNSASGVGDGGTFVWADNTDTDFVSTGPNQFLIRADGGFSLNAPPPAFGPEFSIHGRATDDGFGGFVEVMLVPTPALNGNTGEGIEIGVGKGGAGTNDASFRIAHRNGSSGFAERLNLNSDGSVVIRSNTNGTNTGVSMAANAGAWSSLSDHRLKTAIVPVDAGAILDRVLDLPMATWSYIAQGEGIRHIGPMAQDFAAAFGLGENDTTISTIDADGVALAAIQGLNAKLEAENAAIRDENAAMRTQLAALAERLARLETRSGE